MILLCHYGVKHEAPVCLFLFLIGSVRLQLWAGASISLPVYHQTPRLVFASCVEI